MKHWPCSSCAMNAPCEDCYAIKQAEDRQRQEIADIYAGRKSRSWGADLEKRLSDGFSSITAAENDEEEDE